MALRPKNSEQQDFSLPANTPQKLLSRNEVDAKYGIPKRFLEIAACKGGGPVFVKVGRLTRYRVEDIEDWIAQHRFSSTSEAVEREGRNR